MKKNIVLIGMPAAGKSTIGVLLAKTLGMPFVDTDLLIQEKEEKLLQNIINELGTQKFLEIEQQTIIKTNLNKSVIATGGSVVYSDKAMKHLKSNGIIIYLQLNYDEIINRLNNIKTRGIAMDKSKSLKELYEERIPLYHKYSDFNIDCNGKDMERIVDEIVEIS